MSSRQRPPRGPLPPRGGAGRAARWLGGFLAFLLAWGVMAAPPPGAQISNQAIAGYLDAAGAPRSVSSNLVTLSVAQVASFTLAADTTRVAAPGDVVQLPQLLANTGNGADRFALAAALLPGAGFTPLAITLHADANGDGIADNTLPLADTGMLAAGAAFRFVVALQVPAGAAPGAVARVRVDAASVLDPTMTTGGATPPRAALTDTVLVGGGAAVGVTKQLSLNAGASPSPAPLTVTLRYANTGSAPASDLRLADTLPPGLRYVAGSARWSALPATPLTDAGGDSQGSAAQTIAYDFSAGSVNARIAQVAAGASGALSFAVEVVAGLAPGLVDNVAQFRFNDAAVTLGPYATNTASYQVLAGAALSMTGATVAAAAPGTPLLFANVLRNDGNASDSFDITLGASSFSTGSTLQLLRADGATLLTDTDGNGVPDTGPLAPGASTTVVLRLVTPAASAGGPYSVTKTATSRIDPSRRASALDTLGALSHSGTALITLAKSASTATTAPGADIQWSFTIANVGAVAALPATAVTIDGVPATRALLRDALPPNTRLESVGAPPTGAVLLYHQAGAPLHGYTSTAPADPASVDAVALAYAGPLPSGYGATWSLGVQVAANAAANSSGQIANRAQFHAGDGIAPGERIVDSNTATVAIAAQPAAVRNYSASDYLRIAPYVRPGDTLYLAADAASCNADAGRAETRIAVITGPNGERETYDAVETAPNSGVFRVAGVPTRDAAVVAGDAIVQARNRDTLGVELQGCATAIVTTIVLIDPAGVVFDARSNQPVAGAAVTLVRAAAGVCTTTPASVNRIANGLVETAPSTVITGSDGRYEFPLVAPADYCLAVVPPAGWSFASLVAPVDLPGGRNISPTGSYGGVFSVSPAEGPVLIDLPLDARAAALLTLRKTASRQHAEVADFIDYTLKLRNGSGAALAAGAVVIDDRLPAGFVYQPGSARLDAAPLPDPAGGRGPILRFTVPPVLSANAEATLSYRVRVGAGALRGDGINRARASAGSLVSNEARAKVELQGGVFSDRGVIVGRVFLDCNRNRVLDAGEAGIPGVRLYLEDGTNVVTDGEGRYNLYGISARTHVLKLDNTSLPADAELIALNNRHAGDAGSRFVDLKAGELHKANFALGVCTPALRDEVKARRARAELQTAETERTLTRRLDADAQTRAPADPKGLPASGIAGAASELAPAGALALQAERAAPAVSGLPQAPIRAVPLPAEPLEHLLPGLPDNSLGFIGLADGDRLPQAQTHLRVKGTAGARFVLTVNGSEVSPTRVGKKSVLADKQLQAWEYIGVALQPGDNRIEVTQFDDFGNPRGARAITVVAPDGLAKLQLAVARDAPADGRSAALVEVKLADARGTPVTVRTPLTLEATLGRWDVADLDAREPGVQVFIEGGRAEFALVAPPDPGSAQLRVSSGAVAAEGSVHFLPDLRPLIANGLVEGVLNLRKLSGAVQPARAHDGFEQQLQRWSRASSDGRHDAGARAAFFLKGKVKGEYLLTAGFDSDKATRERLFRDIQPDEYYPIYGDSALRGFDAQSTGRLYVRIDHQKSYLLAGDFVTWSQSDARKLANYSRSLTGIKHHYENHGLAANVYASYDATRQVIDELRANGTSGPFALSTGGLLENSERVELLVRDRNQPAIVLQATTLARFADYQLEPLTGQLLLRAPLPSLDANLNPQSIRISYEVEQAGQRFWVAGADAQVRLNDRLEVGASAVEDRNPVAPARLRGVNATFKLAERTWITAEAAQARRGALRGDAQRVELKHESDTLQALLHAGRTDPGFDNPGAMLSLGRSEAGARAQLKWSDATVLRAEALYSKDTVQGGERAGVLAAVEHRFDDRLRAELGLRHARETGVPAFGGTGTQSADVTSVRARVTAVVPGLPQASVYGEYEQDVRDADKRIAALGGDWQIHERARLYLRHEFISSLIGPYALNGSQKHNATVFGVDADVMKGGHLFGEYRIRDAWSGGDAEAAIGLRNQWTLAPGVRLGTSFERVHTLAGSGRDEASAGSLAIDTTANPDWKASARLELRSATSTDTALVTSGLAVKLNRDWTALARQAYALARNKGSLTGERLQHRVQAGLAWRDSDTDVWNALGRFEHRVERDDTTAIAPLKRRADILALSANYQPTQAVVWSGRLAAKWAVDDSHGLASRSTAQLASLRATRDLTPLWDVSGIVSVLRSERGRQWGAGFEVGYLLKANLWLSAGMNFHGYKDSDLAGSDHTQRGVFLRLRFKFDEDLLLAATPKKADQ